MPTQRLARATAWLRVAVLVVAAVSAMGPAGTSSRRRAEFAPARMKAEAPHVPAVRATRVSFAGDVTVSSVSLRSIAAQGDIQLAIYDDREPRRLLWTSVSTPNRVAGGDVLIPIALGSQRPLLLPAGNYWIAWQSNAADLVAEPITDGSTEGFTFVQPFGDFPATITSSAAPVTTEGWRCSMLTRPGTPADISVLANASMRGLTGTGDNVMITGFIIGGTVPKPVLINGWGEGLRSFGVQPGLGPVRLRLFRGQQEIATNERWIDSAYAIEIAASGAAPPTDRDASIYAVLEPGLYTAHLEPADGVPGVGLLEVHDLSGLGGLVNLSLRGPSGTGDKLLIAGFIVNGAVPKRILVNGLVGGLGAYGVPNLLPAPRLRFFRETELLSETASPSGFPGIASDLGAVLTVEEGTFTGHLFGSTGGEGNALLEIYDLDDWEARTAR